jgi:hypothetical protein
MKVKLYSVAEYAKKLDISRQALLERIKSKNLPEGVSAQQVGRSWVIIVE